MTNLVTDIYVHTSIGCSPLSSRQTIYESVHQQRRREKEWCKASPWIELNQTIFTVIVKETNTIARKCVCGRENSFMPPPPSPEMHYCFVLFCLLVVRNQLRSGRIHSVSCILRPKALLPELR